MRSPQQYTRKNPSTLHYRNAFLSSILGLWNTRSGPRLEQSFTNFRFCPDINNLLTDNKERPVESIACS